MTDNLKKLLDTASGDGRLSEKLAGLAAPEEIIAFAKELGIDLTADDLQTDQQKSGEIDDDELEAVAGGGKCVCVVGGGGKASKDGDDTCACGGLGFGYDTNSSANTRCFCAGAGYGKHCNWQGYA